MKRAKWLMASMTLIVVLLLGAACNSEATATPRGGANAGGTSNLGALGSLTSAELAAFAGSIAPALGQSGGNQQAGIWVTGIGQVTLEPDLALLSLGVEVRADTVEGARAEAATAMTRIIEALGAQGVAEKDIQTRFFNISPEYTYQEITKDGRRYNKQVLTGYRVSNTVTAKIRDLDTVGETIDDVVQAGGDVTRIQNIQFTVEDSSEANTQARESAVLDALAKADQFASLTGVARGSLLFITGLGSSMPAVREFAAADGVPALALEAVTPVSIGELEIRVSVQAVFAIGTP